MALAPLAVAADLSARGIDVTDTALVDAMLAAASEAIRDAAGAPISQTTSTVTIPGRDGAWLDLPGQPVTSVASVDLDGVAVTDHKFIGGRLWRRCGWNTYPCEPSAVTVTMTHGFVEVPADIVQLVCDFAIAGMLTKDAGATAGVVSESESIDDYTTSKQYAQGSDSTASVMEVPERTARMLAARFGGGAYVVSEQS